MEAGDQTEEAGAERLRRVLEEVAPLQEAEVVVVVVVEVEVVPELIRGLIWEEVEVETFEAVLEL